MERYWSTLCVLEWPVTVSQFRSGFSVTTIRLCWASWHLGDTEWKMLAGFNMAHNHFVTFLKENLSHRPAVFSSSPGYLLAMVVIKWAFYLSPGVIQACLLHAHPTGTSGRCVWARSKGWKPRLKKNLPWGGIISAAHVRIAPSTAEGELQGHGCPCNRAAFLWTAASSCAPCQRRGIRTARSGAS